MARDRKAALAASIQAERETARARVPQFDKFARAEAALGRVRGSAAGRVGKPAAGAVEKVVRDSFTMPATDYAKIARIRERCLKAGVSVTKGEVLRAGLRALERLSAGELLQAMRAVEKVKPGRPKQR
jgi:hypothetical protein